MGEQLYVYAWGNNPRREEMRGRVCRVVCRGRLNSCLVEFVDNRQREVISRHALRKRRDGQACGR